ncbi:MAG: sulfate/molybdate ABC transporter ATP-binding protein [Cellulosilyticaceae bacterium]
MKLVVTIKKQLNQGLLDVHFETSEGILALLGASGCGKSMTLKCIAGIETPDSGLITLGDTVLYDAEKGINLPPQKRGVGYLFQNYALFPNMTVAQNIGISVAKPLREQVVREKIKTFHLEGLEDQYPRHLSGGQQQRVALARMMAANPKVILLDEPFAALDDHLKWQLEQELLETMESFLKPVLFVSHNQEEVYHLCDRIGIIEDGKMHQVQDKKALFAAPKTRAQARLCGYKNILPFQKIEDYKGLLGEGCYEMLTKQPIPEGVKFVGLGQNALAIVEESQSEQVISCEILRQIEEPDAIIWSLRSLGGLGGADTLRYKVSYDQARGYKPPDEVRIAINGDELVYLVD